MKNGAGSYRRFLDGDESAFDDLLALYQENLIFFINRYVHNITVAEDLAADVFLDLIVHKHRYNFKTSLKTYLFMIGRSRALNYLKREGRCRTVEISEAGELIQEETKSFCGLCVRFRKIIKPVFTWFTLRICHMRKPHV